MSEIDPLNHTDVRNGQIVFAEPKFTTDAQSNGNGHGQGHGQGNGVHTSGRTTPHANGKHGAGPTPPSAPEPHIEAPCCRDIHGKEPPDGGMRAWLVMLSAFLCNGVIFGIINTYGVIHSLLADRLGEQGDTEASSKAALVGSLTIGTTFLLSPVAGCLTDKIGLRLTTFIGGVFSAGGLFISSFCTDSIEALYLTYGIMFGFGAALAYTPTLAILGHYFKRYLGKVSGFVTAGSSVFTVILPPSLDYLLRGYGLELTLQVMSFISCFIIVCSFVYKPLHPPPEPPKKKPGRSRFALMLRTVINVEIWKRKRYVIWAMCVPMALFGYFVPYVHMVKFVRTVFPGHSENLPVMCIGVTSGIGRLIFGAIADLPGVNRIFLQQLSLICIGAVTLLLPLTSSYGLLIVFTLVMGLFDGCFISLLGPIAYEICGPSGATQAIGFMLGLSSLPLTVGPPIAGKLFDSSGSYTLPLILAGIPPIVGALVMFLVRCVHDDRVSAGAGRSMTAGNGVRSSQDVERHAAVPKESWTEGRSKSDAPLMNGHANGIHGSVTPAAVANGCARLADTGIDSNAASAYLRPTACHACGNGSSSCFVSSADCSGSQVALLASTSMSSAVDYVDDNDNDNDNDTGYGRPASGLSHTDLSGKTSNFIGKRRRYKYSIF